MQLLQGARCRYELVTQAAWLGTDHAEILVLEELEAARPGEELLLLRQSATIELTRNAAGWRVTGHRNAGSGPASEYLNNYWISPHAAALRAARRTIRNGGRGGRAALALIERATLPHVITVALGPSRVPEDQEEAVSCALRCACSAWNALLAGAHRFVIAEDATEAHVQVVPRHPSWSLPGSGRMAWADPGSARRRDVTRWTVHLELPDPMLGEVLPESPARLCAVLSHELGHVLGLGESRQAGSVMAPTGPLAPLPVVGTYDAASVRRLRDLFARYTSAILRESAVAPAFSERRLVRETEIPTLSVPIAGPLPPAPAEWVALTWRGDEHLRNGEWPQALRHFESAARLAPEQREPACRACFVRAVYGARPDLEIPRIRQYLRLGRPSRGIAGPQSLHSMLAQAFERLGCPRQARFHREVCNGWLAAGRLLTTLDTAGQVFRSGQRPRGAALALRAALLWPHVAAAAVRIAASGAMLPLGWRSARESQRALQRTSQAAPGAQGTPPRSASAVDR